MYAIFRSARRNRYVHDSERDSSSHFEIYPKSSGVASDISVSYGFRIV